MIKSLMEAAGINDENELSGIISERLANYIADKTLIIYASPKGIASCHVIEAKNPTNGAKSIRVSDLILDLMGVFDNSVIRSLIRRQGLGEIDTSLGAEIGGSKFLLKQYEGSIIAENVETLDQFDLIDLLKSGIK